MANFTLSIRRSDLFPVGTNVKFYGAAGRHIVGARPSGPVLATATVDAAGVLSLSWPQQTPWTAAAEVEGEWRVLNGGDPTRPLVRPTLRERIARRRAFLGA